MNRQAGLIICLTYCISLFWAGLLGFPQANISGLPWGLCFLGLILLSLITALILPRVFYRLPPAKFWLVMGLIAILSVVYLQIRLPHPSSRDISRILSKNQPYQEISLTGKTLTSEQEVGNQKRQIWVNAKRIEIKSQSLSQQVIGKVYVTLPQTPEIQIHPNQAITIEGILYQPRPPDNPYSFNFQRYLERQGTFAGLKGQKFELIGEPRLGWWQLRKRIINSQNSWIPNQEASLISSIVLGRKAVNFPRELKELFINVGMAHIVSASGFHVSLLLGVTLLVTRYLSPQKQLIIGLIILTIYIGLTGIYPSIIRASIMGIGMLMGATVDQKKDSLASLLLAATILLIYNPLWLWDLGFQLSFLATFALLTTLPTLQNSFDFLPSRIAAWVAIPLAASLWTFPLLSHTFSVLILYSIPLNILTTPLVYLISLGGIISAAISLIIPSLGSAIAGLLFYPTHWLISLATFTVNLPGNYYITGKLPLGITLIIYGLFILTWLHHDLRQRWPLVGLVVITLLIITPVYHKLFLTQVTLFSSETEPIMIIEDRGKITLLNYGDKTTNKYTLMPFLFTQGISKIDCVINVGNFPYYSSSCLKSDPLPIAVLQENPNTITSQLYPFKDSQIISVGSTEFQLLSQSLTTFQIKTKTKKWHWILQSNTPLTKVKPNLKPTPDTLLWSGEKLSYPILKQLKGKTAIALSYPVSKSKEAFFQKQNINLYSLKNDGLIQWTPRKGFISYLDNYSPRDW